MFSSLASFLFGSNTSATTNCEFNQSVVNQGGEDNQLNGNKEFSIDEAEDTIEVTASTPSVTGASTSGSLIQQNKRGKNKRARNSNKNKRNGSAGAGQKKPTSSITKLLTPTDSVDEDIDDDDWYIVEKEGEGEDESLPRTDSEEEVSVVEIKSKLSTPAALIGQQARRRNFHINSHSLYSGPRPQQQRNFLQRARNSGARVVGPLSASTLNPTRHLGSPAALTIPNGLADGSMTQSLYVASTSSQTAQQQHNLTINDTLNGANASMEESWYVTPPPCFTSVGPVNMETSPFENLLIEHPSMSVYHSIRSAQEATESFVNLDLGVNESQQKRSSTAVATVTNGTRNHSIQHRGSAGARIDRQSAAQIKQELLARTNQKNREKKERQQLCSTAMKRSNAAREVQSKGGRLRRADLQHYRVNSSANNNRNTNRKTFQ